MPKKNNRNRKNTGWAKTKSSPQVSPFPEYEVHGNDENGRKETEK